LDKEKIKLLGRLLTQKDKIDGKVRVLQEELGMSSATASLLTSTPQTTLPPATPKTAPSPRKESAAGAPASAAKTKSAARVKQGQYMGLLRSLKESDQKLVRAANESSGIDHAISLARRLRGVAAEKAAEVATEAPDPDSQETFDEGFEDI